MSVNPHSLRLDGAFWTMWTRLYVVSQTYGYRGLTLELWIMGFYRNDRSQAMHSVLSQSCFSPIGWGEGWFCTALSLSLFLSLMLRSLSNPSSSTSSRRKWGHTEKTKSKAI